jgi:hypothetical protein
MQLEDIDRKLERIAKTTAAGDWKPAGGGWDPDKHPRAGTSPNPGWFASTSGDVAMWVRLLFRISRAMTAASIYHPDRASTN